MKLSLVIPAYNEEGSIAEVVRALRTVFVTVEPSFEIIVVDNGSSDRTGVILRELLADVPELKTVRVEVNRGYGNGVITGLHAARGDILGWVDADNQIAPGDVLDVYRKILHEQSGLAKAVRVVRGDSYFRTLQSSVFNGFFHILFGGHWRDINAKPKFFRRELFQTFHLSSLDWFVDAEVMIKVIRAKGRIMEVEVPSASRKAGKSNVSLRTSCEFVANMLRYRFSNKKP